MRCRPGRFGAAASCQKCGKVELDQSTNRSVELLTSAAVKEGLMPTMELLRPSGSTTTTYAQVVHNDNSAPSANDKYGEECYPPQKIYTCRTVAAFADPPYLRRPERPQPWDFTAV